MTVQRIANHSDEPRSTNGTNGLNGANGTNGKNGLNGAIGTNGTNGASQIKGTENTNGNGVGNINGSAGSTHSDTIHLENGSSPNPEPIAICGIGLRLPGGIEDAKGFWDFLINKRDARKTIPANRYNIDGFYSPTQKAASISFREGYFLDSDLDRGDAGFFTATRAEYELLDPQQRLLLEVTQEAFQDAGETDFRGKDIGVYAGVYAEDWHDLHSIDLQETGMYRTTGHGDFVLGNRVSYEYDLHGPSMTIRVGCSSTMVGLHLACEAIQRGDCSGAIIGGANIIMSPFATIAMIEHGVLSPEASVKAFDASADGYARGEAVNAIYIKKLSDAVRDGNPIRAVIRGTSSNCDGKTPGMSNPSSEAHEALIRKAYQAAGLKDYSETAMVECHGTGTPVGDPLEVNAVANIFGEKGVLIGSVKPNVGHSEGASGLTSIIKAVLSLEKRTILPNIKFNVPNPRIPWEKARLTVPIEAMPFPEDRSERISINSFGLGGANAHAILDSAAQYDRGLQRSTATTEPSIPRLLVFSANHASSLEKIVNKHKVLVGEGAVSLRDLSYTLGVRRDHMANKAFAIVNGTSFEASSVTKSSQSSPPIFVFTGQGAQWPAMGKELMDDYPSFLADIRQMDNSLKQLKQAPSWTIESELLKPETSSRINKAEMSQPLCTAVQVALVNLLRSWDLSSSAVVGHSSGEIAAAYAVGAFTMETAIRIAFYRGYVANTISRKGAMAAIGFGRDIVRPYLTSGVVLACENSGGSVTISGDDDKVQNTIEKVLHDTPDAFARKLKVEIAYHSFHMADVGQLYESIIQQEFSDVPQDLTAPFYSSVTGETYTTSAGLGASYWRQNLESPVLFYTAVKSLLATFGPNSVMLEVGPHSALQGPLRQIFKETAPSASYASCLSRGTHSTVNLLKALGQLHCIGVKIDFEALNQGGASLSDLPTYAWNHDNVYWRESRLSRDYRARKYPHHDLLGARILENTDIEPAWRGSLELGRLPWLQEHALHKDIVFPAAGFIATVGEAIRQVSDGVEEYMVRNVVVASALIILPTRPTEVITRFSRHRLTKTIDSTWYDFTIISNNGNGWTRNCFGQIRSGRPVSLEVPVLQEYPRKVSSQRWYRQMHKIGLQYGPAFRGLHRMSASPTEHAASAHVVDKPREGQSPYVYHPCSLDWVFQAFSLAAHHGVPRDFAKMCLPAYIEELYIASGGEEIHMNLTTSLVPGGAFTCSADGVSEGKVKFRLKGMKIEPFDDASAIIDERSHGAVQLEWRPDVEFLDASTLLRQVPDIKEEHKIIEKLSLLCSIETAELIKELTTTSDYLEKYRGWTEDRIARARNGDNPLLSDAADLVRLSSSQRQALIEDLMESTRGIRIDAPAEAIYVVYKSIAGVYRGEVDILDVLLKGNVLTNLYNFLNADCHDFMQLLGHSKPTLRILEIGAGTGGLTALIMEALHTSYGERMYSQYTYTDISAGFFVAAKERFKEMPGVEYAVLDISRDPLAQNFEAGAYDLIIASNVLHATPSLEQTLRHCRTLLHPQGRLFLQELCSESKWINYIMGVLPGWWLGEADGRSQEPYVGHERWDKELRKAGFAGAQTFFQDQDSPYQFNAHIIARPELPSPAAGRIAFLTNDKIPEEAVELEHLFVKEGYSVEYRTLEQGPAAGVDTLALLDLDKPFLHEATSETFQQFVRFVHDLGSSRLLWVTKSSQVAVKDPRYALILGMARAIRTELGATFGTLELDEFTASSWQPVLDVFKKFQHPPVSATSIERSGLDADVEYALSDGLISTPRFHWITIGEELAKTKDTTMKGLWVGKPGLIQSLEWRPFDFPKLSPEHVEIETRAAGLNFKDVLRALGIVPGTAVEGNYVGQDCAGVVRAVGSNVTHIKPGDRVLSCTPFGFSTRFQTLGRLCIKIPDSLSFEDASTMVLVYITVFEALERCARLEKGQTVLIHSATGGVGFAAIQVAKSIGAEIYATVGSEEKVKFVMETHNIPRDHIFSSRDESFKDKVLKATNGRGVDVVLNSLSGELLHASWKCVAEYGMMVEIGKTDLIGEGRLAMEVFEQNRGYFGVDVSKLPLEHPAPTAKYLNRIIDGYNEGVILPVRPITTFDAENIQEAFRFMQKGQHIGKIVVQFPDDPDALPTAPVIDKLSFKPDVSYFLPGGLGGLGRAIAVWMADHGARHLIFMSRSGAENIDQDFFEELGQLGCAAQVFSGDLAKLDDVKRVVQQAEKPIAGVMQMAMVLQDRALGQMTWEDWQAAIMPKVPATWNIHEALKDSDLDFFVCFASGSGIIGQSGQANYAAGNTFNDAFVQYRHSLGLRASVLDIGVVEDIGYVSEKPQILESLRAAGFHLLSERDLLESLHLMIVRSDSNDNSMSPPTRTTPFCSSAQVTLGMRTELPLADPSNRCSWKRDPRMAAYRDSGSQTAAGNRAATDEVLLTFMSAVTADPARLRTPECIQFLVEQIGSRVLGFLMVPDKEIDPAATLNDVGLDSLVAIELRNWWRQNLGSDISVLELLNANLQQLGSIAAERLLLKIEGSGVGAEAKAREQAEQDEGKVTGEQYTLMKSL